MDHRAVYCVLHRGSSTLTYRQPLAACSVHTLPQILDVHAPPILLVEVVWHKGAACMKVDASNLIRHS